MDPRLRDNGQTIALLVGGVLLLLSYASGWHLAPLVVGGIFVVLGLFGDRITEVSSAIFGFKMVARRVAQRLNETTSDHATITLHPDPVSVSVQAVAPIVRVQEAKTPEELADRIVDFMRTVPDPPWLEPD